jgi:hypothetical protein
MLSVTDISVGASDSGHAKSSSFRWLAQQTAATLA